MRRSPRILTVAFSLLLLVGSAVPVAAQDGDGATEGGIFLLLPIGARAVALGRAMTAVTGTESVFWNPAGLGDLSGRRLILYKGSYVAGDAISASGLVSQEALGTVGVTYHLLDVGEQDLTDGQGNVLGTISVRNHLGVFSAATRVWDRVNLGVNLKVVQFRQSCRGQCLDAGVTATTYAVDAGVQVADVLGLPLRLGAMVANAGPRFQVRNEEQADPLPTRMRAGAAYELSGRLISSEELSLVLTAEVEERWRNRSLEAPALYLGGEFGASVEDAVLSVRAGYVIGNGEQVDGAAVGVGLRYTRFDLSIAKSLAANIADVNEPVHVTFGLVF